MTAQAAQVPQADHPPGTRFLAYAPDQMQAVLADRHVAQLPIRADVVGVHLQVAPPDVVECHVPPYEPLFQIELLRLDHAV